MNLYHGSSQSFKKFTLGEMKQYNHPNSCLGIWFYSERDLAALHGRYVYLCEVQTRRTKTYRVAAFQKVCRGQDIMFFQQMRRDLINAGFDSFCLEEDDMSKKIWVSLLLDQIKIISLKES